METQRSQKKQKNKKSTLDKNVGFRVLNTEKIKKSLYMIALIISPSPSS